MAAPRQRAARRYAEAAFEVATRDDTLDGWRARARRWPRARRRRAGRATSSPTRPSPLERRGGRASTELLGERVSTAGPEPRSGCCSGAAGSSSSPRVAAEFRRLDDARQGITHATATCAAPD